MKSAKVLGFDKGDLVYTGAFPGIIVMDVHTMTPTCEVWGIAHEIGSAYASDLTLLEPEEWLVLARQYRFDTEPPYSAEAKRAIKKLKLGGYLK